MTMNYGKHFSTTKTPQNQPIPGSSQVKNSAGGYSWAVDDWTRLDRFLILGTEGGSYYASEKKLTKDNAKAVLHCIQSDGPRAVNRIVEISDAGRAPKNDPAIFALAMAAKLGNPDTRKLALEALHKVCRIGTHLFHFAEYVQAFGGWGRGLRTAVANWYLKKPADKLAMQLVKYQSRDNWSHRDLLRLSHPKTDDVLRNAMLRWAVGKEVENNQFEEHGQLIFAFEQAKKAVSAKEIVKLIQKYRLPREAVPTQWLNEAVVWEALLDEMPMTALVRNLGNMSKVGLLKPMSAAVGNVVAKLGNQEEMVRSRIHPLQMLVALNTYNQGHGVRGSGTWTVVQQVVDALDAGFYKAFKAVEPTNKRTLLALDVSGSMSGGLIAGLPGITPRVGSSAMAMVTAAVEPVYHVMAFSTTFMPIKISPKMRLDQVCATTERMPFSGTDCALPMLWALQNKVEVDTFVVYTDNETWQGHIHAAQALKDYRQKMGIPSKSVVVGMVANNFTIANPNDAGMLDLVGFDTNAPAAISEFVRG